MKAFKLYFIDKGKILLCVLLMSLFMACLLALYNVPAGDIAYALCLCFFVIIVMGIFDWLRWHKRYSLITSLYDIDISESDVKNLERNLFLTNLEDTYVQLFYKILRDNVDLNNQILDKQRLREEYYSMWVHQIKTPIAAMKLLLETDEDVPASKEKLTELFRIEQYVDMAIQYERIDSETTDFVFENCKLEPIIRGAIRKYARLFIGKKLSLDFEGTDCEIITDAKWLGFLVEQLLSNAVKYTFKGGVAIRVLPKDEELAVEIEDTGIGIRAQDLPRIWEKGYTGYNGHANEHSTGIGLYLCRQITNRLGYGLDIASKEGEGTKVTILIKSRNDQL